jgi:hypothetical protein
MLSRFAFISSVPYAARAGKRAGMSHGETAAKLTNPGGNWMQAAPRKGATQRHA